MVKAERLKETERKAAILQAQRLGRRYIPEGVSLSDELIVERRVEARREGEETK